MYSSKRLFNNLDREYLEISLNELKEIKKFSDDQNSLTASIFDEKRLNGESLDFDFYKIASRTLIDDMIMWTTISTQRDNNIFRYVWLLKGTPFSEKISNIYIVSQNTQHNYDLKCQILKTLFFTVLVITIGTKHKFVRCSRESKIIENIKQQNINVLTQQACM